MTEYSECLDYLKVYGPQIGPMAKSGDAAAKSVVDFYTIYWLGPSHSALALVKAAVDDFRRQHPEMEDGYKCLKSN